MTRKERARRKFENMLVQAYTIKEGGEVWYQVPTALKVVVRDIIKHDRVSRNGKVWYDVIALGGHNVHSFYTQYPHIRLDAQNMKAELL